MALVASGANVHDVKNLDATLDAIIVPLPNNQDMHLCADNGYAGREHYTTISNHGYIPNVRGRKQESDAKRQVPGFKARRWVVEACHGWLNRFRKILVRFEKTLKSHLALLHFAFAIICWRKVI